MGGLSFSDIDYVAVGRDAAANRAKKIEYIVKHPTKLLNLLNIKKSRSGLDDLKALIVERCGVPAADLRFEQVLDANAESCRLVRVAGPDAALRGADPQLPETGLARLVQQHEMARFSR